MTDTPEKKALEEEQLNRKKPKQVPKKSLVLDSDTSDSDITVLMDSSDSDFELETLDHFDFECDKCEVGDFVVVKFEGKKHLIHYVAQIETLDYDGDDGDIIAKFLRRKRGSREFVFPQVEDNSPIYVKDVIMKLPPPQKCGGTQRKQSIFTFEVNLSQFVDLR